MSETKMKDLYKEENKKEAEKQKTEEVVIKEIPDSKKYIKYRKFYWFFIILTVLSLTDMMTREFMSTQHGINSGYLSLLVGSIFSFFGDNFAALLMVISDTVFSLALVWIVLIFVMRSKIKKLK